MRQNIRWFAGLAVVVLACVLVAGCNGPSDGNGGQQTPPPTTGGGTGTGMEQFQVAWANNRFAADLYQELAAAPANSGKNIFFSPFSISSALAITYEGARGTTADEIRSVFSFPQDSTVLREGYKTIDAGLNAGDPAYELSTANALWAEESYPFLPGYVQVAKDYYGADVTNLDFINEPEESRLTINDWVEDQTHDRIQDLIPAGSIDADTRLVITNAVYFLGTWETQFDKNETRDMDFLTADGSTVTAEMMYQDREDASFGYAATDTLQVLSMPYKSEEGAKLSMLVLLPKGDDLAAAEAALDPAELERLNGQLSYKQVVVYFPKFRLETQYSLPGALASMGMPTAFSTGADFSGMDGTRELMISDVIHKAFVDVDEEGTEAAAATAVIMVAMAAPAYTPEPVPVFKADHPFIFLVQDDETGAVLFLGRVTDPTV